MRLFFTDYDCELFLSCFSWHNASINVNGELGCFVIVYWYISTFRLNVITLVLIPMNYYRAPGNSTTLIGPAMVGVSHLPPTTHKLWVWECIQHFSWLLVEFQLMLSIFPFATRFDDNVRIIIYFYEYTIFNGCILFWIFLVCFSFVSSFLHFCFLKLYV